MNSFIPRELGPSLKQMADWFPVVSLTGPRQSGKSTLAQHAFPEYKYVNLEDPQTRSIALEDPVSFIRNQPEPLIIDEVQYAPDIFSMIQVVSDERRTNGQYILTGSQNFLQTKNINQSLAGRVGLLNLLPFAFLELKTSILNGMTVEEFLIKGGYPRIYSSDIPPRVYFPNYISTYIEHDVAGLLDVRNKASFRKLLSLCAHTCGNLLNMSSLANEADVSLPSVKSWISILESSFIIFMLQPYSQNSRKRITKTPKLYFYDTGLLCHLLNIETQEQLETHPMFGSIFENLIVAETLKHHLNNGAQPELYFYRDDSKREIDLIDRTERSEAYAAELKSSRTFHDKYAKQLNAVCDEIGISPENRYVVSRAEGTYRTGKCKAINVSDWLMNFGDSNCCDVCAC